MAKENRQRTHQEPPALTRLRETLTEERALREFREVFGREPRSDEQLAMFIEQLTLEMYNAGWDAWPDEGGQPGAA